MSPLWLMTEPTGRGRRRPRWRYNRSFHSSVWIFQWVLGPPWCLKFQGLPVATWELIMKGPYWFIEDWHPERRLLFFPFPWVHIRHWGPRTMWYHLPHSQRASVLEKVTLSCFLCGPNTVLSEGFFPLILLRYVFCVYFPYRLQGSLDSPQLFIIIVIIIIIFRQVLPCSDWPTNCNPPASAS